MATRPVAPATAAPRYRRLSASPVWAAQRRFYERAGIDAWRAGVVPHHVTSNVALATAYARVVLGFVRDVRPRDPVHVIELGAGSGRFTFLFLRALDALGQAAAIRFVMTDVAEATIASWRTHDALRPYFRAGRLEAARFDADRDGRLHIGRGASALTPDAPARHLVVIANYLFSGLRQDAFAIGGGRLREYLAAAAWARGRPRHPADVSVAWRVGGFASAPYANPELDGLVHECGKTSADDRFLFPIGALRCLDRLAACASDALLVLVADRGTRDEGAATTRAADLELGRHGALSFPVSFHALRRWTVRRGGVWLPSPRRSRHLQVAGFMLGRRRRWIATRRAYAAALAAGEPDALYGERRALAGMASARLPALLSLMRRAGADPRVVAECVRPLWSHLARPDPWLRREIRDAVRAAWASYYHADAIDDVPFHLGLLLYQVGAYADAQHLFEASIRLHGEHAAARWNLGLCQLALRRPHAAQSSLRRARAMCPTLQPAGLILSKA